MYIMYALIGNIAFAFFIIGLILTIILAFTSIWKAHYNKTKISKEKFVKFIYLIGITSTISGVSFIVSTTVDSLPELSIFRILLMSVICVGVYPIAMVGVYIFDMKYYRYVESDNYKEYEK